MKRASEAIPNLRLQQARKRRNWLQQDIATTIGTTPVNVSRWEQGITFPSPDFRAKLSELFGMSVEELGLLAEAPQENTTAFAPVLPSPVSTIETFLSSPEAVTSPPIWNVPYPRNPLFTGRDEILSHLHDKFLISNDSICLLALNGLGGIGKTQTAIEYAYRYSSEYRAVLWANASSQASLLSDLEAIARILHLTDHSKVETHDMLANVKEWLMHHADWLLLLDDVSDLELVRRFLPLIGKGDVLLTTRLRATEPLAQSTQIDPMRAEEGALFLLRRATIMEPTEPLSSVSEEELGQAVELVEILGGLPLALDQAGAYILEIGCSVTEYLHLYQTWSARLLQRRGKTFFEYPLSVATTWSSSFAEIEQVNPVAAEFLRVCAFLRSDGIPKKMIIAGAADLGPILQSVAADPLILNEAIGDLRARSLLHYDTDSEMLAIHRLVQEVLKDMMDHDAQQHWVERVVRAVNRAFSAEEAAAWLKLQPYFPQAEYCVKLIEQRNLSFPEAVQLCQKVEQFRQVQASYDQAEVFSQQGLGVTLGSETMTRRSLLLNRVSTSLEGKDSPAVLLSAEAAVQLGLDNPYSDFAAIRTPSMFFGRTEEMRRIYAALVHQQSISLVGPSHIGKSSLLRHLRLPEMQQQMGYGEALQNYLFVLMDLREFLQESVEGFFRKMNAQVLAQSKDRLMLHPLSEDEPVDSFRELLDQINSQGFYPVLLLDEFDKITRNEHFDPEFFSFLRAQASVGRVSYITASAAPLYEVTHSASIAASPFFNIFSTVVLGSLTYSEARALITVPAERANMPFTDAEVEQILRLTGRHPFFIQRACHFLFEEKYAHNTSEIDLDRVNKVIYTELLPHFDANWQRLTAQQQELLKHEARRATNQQRRLPEFSESGLFRKFLRNKYNIQNLHLTADELEKVLGKINDASALGESELKHLNIVSKRLPEDSSSSTLERGMAIREVLNEAFERLRGPAVRRDGAPEWRFYNILYYRYFKHHLKHEQIAARLELGSVRQYYREQKKAVEALLNTLLEMEASTLQDGNE